EGAVVSIQEMPPAFQKNLALASIRYGKRWDALPERVDRTRSRADGLFYFVDLPNGRYTFSVSLPRSPGRFGTAEGKASVARDAHGDTKMTWVNLALPATAVKGKITGPNHKNGVVMAEVRVRGSGERVFSDAQGQYLLRAIEPGKRSVLVFA